METIRNYVAKPSVKEQMRTQQRELRAIQRDLERDKLQLQRQEKQIEADIKRAAKAGQTDKAKKLAKQLIRIRNQSQKNANVSSSISAISHRTAVIQSNVTLGNAVKGATKAMTTANKNMDSTALSQTLFDFQKESAKMDMIEEMMNDTIDSTMDESEDEEESENIMNQVLDEIGVEMGGKLREAGRVASGDLQELDAQNLEFERRMRALREA
ncbi:hypothetical protein BZG36_00765 [Bifiguratus adelaidae]|uniref:Uncharacterized protein n=1 Tax=Bifiguratus adelaidae TaxID=1938954 RepID=A0A261Y6V5_9FUNG|nr:hypothetical protein BZG36_00765 [Bifiguratus adelaidae]